MAKKRIADREPTSMEGFEPTGALPGTDEKVAVLADRVARGLPLYHEHDAKLDGFRSSHGRTESTETRLIGLVGVSSRLAS